MSLYIKLDDVKEALQHLYDDCICPEYYPEDAIEAISQLPPILVEAGEDNVMRVKYKNTKPFRDLKYGDTFYWQDEYWIKIPYFVDARDNHGLNSVCLTESTHDMLMRLNDTEPVVPVKINLEVE